jgi:membrane-associated phospholipid phosphatase
LLSGDPYAAPPPGFRGRIQGMFITTVDDTWSDINHYYSPASLTEFFLGVGGAAIMANTKIDNHVAAWYDTRIHTPQDSSKLNGVAHFWKQFGNGAITIPTFLAMDLVGRYYGDVPAMGALGDYGDRVTRAYLVGAPSMLLMQWTLGGARPSDGTNSHWNPFENDHGVSGHAFMGSIPFITAANMVDNPFAKGALFVCSTFTGWARIDENAHYLSQVWLGWWMGYLACQAVNETQHEDRHLKIVPLVSPDMTGVGVRYQY